MKSFNKIADKIYSERELLWTSMTADGMTETFVLDTSLFDVANE